MAAIISLDQKARRVRFGSFEMENEMVFSYFDKLAKDERDEMAKKAIYIGVLALVEDRIATFLSETKNELGTELESLKIIFEMKKELFFKSAIKGTKAEDDIGIYLREFINQQNYNDSVELTGNAAGQIAGNKTGDIVCKIENDPSINIVIEVKFDKSIKMGDIRDKNIFIRRADTAWGQLIEAQANRGSSAAIIVFDKALVDGSITRDIGSLGFVRGVGFIAVVDSQAGDYSNLFVAYNLAREIIKAKKDIDYEEEVLSFIVTRIVRDIENLLNVKKYVQAITDNSMKILEDLKANQLSLEFSLQFLKKFLNDKKLSREDLLEFYAGEEVKKEFENFDVQKFLKG